MRKLMVPSLLSLWRSLLALVSTSTVKRLLLGLAGTFAGIGLAAPATASVILTNPDLPPQAGAYIASGPIQFPNAIELLDLELGNFLNIGRTPFGPDEHEDFDATLTLLVDIGAGAEPVTLTGPMQWIASNKTGNTTGTFDIEIVSMGLSGDIGGLLIEIRESPTLDSLGVTTITDLGGGLFQIDSFFDVFTEFSIDSGPFQPQVSGAERFTLTPEPSSIPTLSVWGTLLLGSGLLALAAARRRAL